MNATFVSRAREWVGTPYEHAGRLKGVGVDCVGMVLGVCKEVGFIPNDYATPFYESVNDGSLISELFPLFGRQKDLDAMSVGDVVVCSVTGNPQHVGILGDNAYGINGLSLIHSYACSEKVVEHPLDEKWLRRIVSVWEVTWVN